VDAQNFVANLMTEEESVGKVTAVPSYNRLRRQQETEEENEDDTDRENQLNQRQVHESAYNSESNDEADGAEEAYDDDESDDGNEFLHRGEDEVPSKVINNNKTINAKKRKVPDTVKLSSKSSRSKAIRS